MSRRTDEHRARLGGINCHEEIIETAILNCPSMESMATGGGIDYLYVPLEDGWEADTQYLVLLMDPEDCMSPMDLDSDKPPARWPAWAVLARLDDNGLNALCALCKGEVIDCIMFMNLLTARDPSKDHWADDPEYPKSDWQHEVANGDTLRGYRDWVASMREQDEHDRKAGLLDEEEQEDDPSHSFCSDCGSYGSGDDAGTTCRQCGRGLMEPAYR